MEKNFIDKIDNLIKKHHLLNHSFYKAWNAGELPKETIREYAAQYFQQWSTALAINDYAFCNISTSFKRCTFPDGPLGRSSIK